MIVAILISCTRIFLIPGLKSILCRVVVKVRAPVTAIRLDLLIPQITLIDAGSVRQHWAYSLRCVLCYPLNLGVWEAWRAARRQAMIGECPPPKLTRCLVKSLNCC